MASKQLNIALAVFAIVQATKSPVINSHTFSLQIHGGPAQCLQSEWYRLHELHYTTTKWSSYHWKWCDYTGHPWKEVVYLRCKRPLCQLRTEACHHCAGRVGVSCTGPLPLHHHSTSTQFCLWDLGVWALASDGNHGCCCFPSCLICS